ncbi:uncharacterized protein [Watersipora subatra]|uniref:uncharacterized protein n=1 Tax=Watersipora subatra TaxID=2589382 RepID=UPI00355C2903
MSRYIATRRRGVMDLRERLYRPPRRERDTRAGIERGNNREGVNRERLGRDGSSEKRNVEAAGGTQEREGSQQEKESIWRRRKREVIERARQDREQKEGDIRRRFESEMAAVEREYDRDVVRAREDRQIAERAIERERARGQEAERVNREEKRQQEIRRIDRDTRERKSPVRQRRVRFAEQPEIRNRNIRQDVPTFRGYVK